MIIHNGLKNNVINAEKAIERMRGISWHARALANAILKLPENWRVNWEYLAKEFNIPIASLYRYRNELTEKGIWKIDGKNIIFSINLAEPIILVENENAAEPINLKGLKPINLVEPINLTGNKKEQSVEFLNKKKKEKKESACVREIDNVECETSQDADKAHEIGQISENVALSAQNSANFAEFETSQTQENENRAEIFCAGGENLTQINFGEGVARTAQHSTASEQGSGAVALGLQKIAFSSSQKPAKMLIGEAYANWQRQIQAAAEFSVKGENLAQNDSEDGTAWRDETSETNEQPREVQTQSEIHAAPKTPKKQRQTPQTPEQIAAAMLEKHGEIAKSANFSDTEREAMLDYFAYKAEHKKYPLTERNSKAILKQCVKIKGENKDLPEIIERTIANGWADLRWVADKPAQNAYKSAWQQQEDERKAKAAALFAKYEKIAAQKAKGA